MSKHSLPQGVSLMQTRADSYLAVHNFALGKNVHAMRDVCFYKYKKELKGSVSLTTPQSGILKKQDIILGFRNMHHDQCSELIQTGISQMIDAHIKHLSKAGEDAENNYSSETSWHNAECIPV